MSWSVHVWNAAATGCEPDTGCPSCSYSTRSSTTTAKFDARDRALHQARRDRLDVAIEEMAADARWAAHQNRRRPRPTPAVEPLAPAAPVLSRKVMREPRGLAPAAARVRGDEETVACICDGGSSSTAASAAPSPTSPSLANSQTSVGSWPSSTTAKPSTTICFAAHDRFDGSADSGRHCKHSARKAPRT